MTTATKADVETGPRILCACGCGTVILQFDDYKRERKYAYGHHLKAMWAARSAPPADRSARTG